MNGVLVATDRHVKGRSARIDEPQVGSGDLLAEQQKGLCRANGLSWDDWMWRGKTERLAAYIPSSASVTSSLAVLTRKSTIGACILARQLLKILEGWSAGGGWG